MALAFPDWISVSIMLQFEIIGGERKIASPGKNLQLTDGIGFVGIFNFIPDGEQKVVVFKIMVCTFTDDFACLAFRLTVANKDFADAFENKLTFEMRFIIFLCVYTKRDGATSVGFLVRRKPHLV